MKTIFFLLLTSFTVYADNLVAVSNGEADFEEKEEFYYQKYFSHIGYYDTYNNKGIDSNYWLRLDNLNTKTSISYTESHYKGFFKNITDLHTSVKLIDLDEEYKRLNLYIQNGPSLRVTRNESRSNLIAKTAKATNFFFNLPGIEESNETKTIFYGVNFSLYTQFDDIGIVLSPNILFLSDSIIDGIYFGASYDYHRGQGADYNTKESQGVSYVASIYLLSNLEYSYTEYDYKVVDGIDYILTFNKKAQSKHQIRYSLPIDDIVISAMASQINSSVNNNGEISYNFFRMLLTFKF
jgi:hypothetical protein